MRFSTTASIVFGLLATCNTVLATNINLSGEQSPENHDAPAADATASISSPIPPSPSGPTQAVIISATASSVPHRASYCTLYHQITLDNHIASAPAVATATDWTVTIGILNKTTSERGQPGQGLFDNIKGDCGAYPGLQQYNGIYWSQSTGALEGYDVTLMMPASADAKCVMSAIGKAEDKSVKCVVQGQ